MEATPPTCPQDHHHYCGHNWSHCCSHHNHRYPNCYCQNCYGNFGGHWWWSGTGSYNDTIYKNTKIDLLIDTIIVNIERILGMDWNRLIVDQALLALSPTDYTDSQLIDGFTVSETGSWLMSKPARNIALPLATDIDGPIYKWKTEDTWAFHIRLGHSSYSFTQRFPY